MSTSSVTKDFRRAEIIWYSLSKGERFYLSFRFLIVYGLAFLSVLFGSLLFVWCGPYSSSFTKNASTFGFFCFSVYVFLVSSFLVSVRLEILKEGIATKAARFGDRAEELFYMKRSALWGYSYSLSAVFVFSLLVYGASISYLPLMQ
jgi:hypothetical protein